MDGRVVRDPEFPVGGQGLRIAVDGQELSPPRRIYLMLNKPRGLVTTVRDEQGRDTVYRCLQDPSLPWLAPVGRLDKASEGLLLFSNDTGWSSRIADPLTGPDKTYHVQVGGLVDDALTPALVAGVEEAGERLHARGARVLRHGTRNTWLEIVLDEGRNRQIRRLLAAFELPVLRLVRVSIGRLDLGELGKGEWRPLSEDEVRALATPSPGP